MSGAATLVSSLTVYLCWECCITDSKIDYSRAMSIVIPTEVRALLTTTPPALTARDAEQLANELFGVKAKSRLLASERDQNFRLDTDDGRRFTFKVSNCAENPAVVEFQNGALQHIAEKDAGIPIPRVIANLDGAYLSAANINSQRHLIRLFSWMDGQILYDVKAQATALQQMGAMLARLGLALQDYEHPGSNPALLWDMKRAGNLRTLLPCIEDRALRSLIEQSLDRFDQVAPELMQLRQQVIYNDLNPDNVLVDPDNNQQITGIIDFGDLVKSPLIIDLAVASAYYLADGSDPLSGTLPLISGYHQLRPLQDAEICILPDLIRTRLITSLLIMSWRISEFPENRDYLQRSQASSKAFLASLSQIDDQTAAAQIRSACP